MSLETFVLKAITSSVDLISSLREFQVTALLYRLFFIKFVLGFGREKFTWLHPSILMHNHVERRPPGSFITLANRTMKRTAQETKRTDYMP